MWTPYADWIYTVVSLSGLLLICWLVLVRSAPLKSTDDGFHLRLQQHITSVVVARHQLWIATLVGVMLHREQFVSTFHLLLRESSGQRQAKALAGLDGVDIRVSPHWALFAAMVRFARLAFGTLLAG